MITNARRLAMGEACSFKYGYMLVDYNINNDSIAFQKKEISKICRNYMGDFQIRWESVTNGLCVKRGFELYRDIQDAVIAQTILQRRGINRLILKMELQNECNTYEGKHPTTYATMISAESVKYHCEEQYRFLYTKKRGAPREQKRETLQPKIELNTERQETAIIND